jgi:hypothetical protein
MLKAMLNQKPPEGLVADEVVSERGRFDINTYLSFLILQEFVIGSEKIRDWFSALRKNSLDLIGIHCFTFGE